MMRIFIAFSLATMLVLAVSACDQKKESDDSNSNYYNVYFIMPKTAERKYIGTVRGLSSCKYTASSYYSHRLWIGKEWDYVCCLRQKENQCVEEQKYGEDK